MVKNMLWLRLLMIFGAISEIIYFYFIGEKPQWNPIIWDMVWILVNTIQFAILIKERVNLKLNDDEEKLYKLSLSNIPIVEYKKLMKIAIWETVEPKTLLIDENIIFNKLMIITNGIAEVVQRNNVVAYIRDGNFMGEMSFITGKETSAQVISFTELSYVYWEKGPLQNLLSKNHIIEEGLKSSFNFDLVNKLIPK